MPSQTLQEFRLLSSTAMRTAVGLGAYMVGAATGLTYPRFLGLRAAADRALNQDNLDDADRLARELLDVAAAFSKDWYHGNAIHHGNLIQGRAALKRGDTQAAGDFLRAAGETPGSPQLNSFGPNMLLAKELLEAGEQEAAPEPVPETEADAPAAVEETPPPAARRYSPFRRPVGHGRLPSPPPGRTKPDARDD